MTRLAAPNAPSGAVIEVAARVNQTTHQANGFQFPVMAASSGRGGAIVVGAHVACGYDDDWDHGESGVSGFPPSMDPQGIVARSGAVSNGRTDSIRDVGGVRAARAASWNHPQGGTVSESSQTCLQSLG